MNAPRVHIVVLNWNGKSDTLECLASLQSVNYPNFEIVVIDNGSTDGSEEAIRAAFPHVALIQTGENLGYAEGNNVGIRRAMEYGADFAFVLNNDTTIDPNVVTALVAQAEKNPNAAILAPKIYFYDRPDVINSAGGHIDYETLVRGHIGYGVRDDGTVHAAVTAVEWATGCAMLLRISALRQVGLFDGDFFLICEELDLCARVRKQGFEILFVPEAKLWHKVSAAFEGNFSAVYCYYIFRNILLYARKNFPDRRFPLYWKLLRDSREFYHRLVGSGDTDYRRKGFCILIGTVHFFTGFWGKAPEWVFRVKFPPKEPVAETGEVESGDLFRAKIRIREQNLCGTAGATITVPLSVRNLSDGTWPAFSTAPVRLCYHLRAEDGKTIVWDGLRTSLPRNLKAGRSINLDAAVRLPDQGGTYIIEWDMVQESVTWFGEKNEDRVQTKITVR